MNEGRTTDGCSSSVMRRQYAEHLALAAAYRDGLGLAAVAVVSGPTGVRVVAATRVENATRPPTEALKASWWCRRLSEAEHVAAAAMARMRRRESKALAGAAAGTPPSACNESLAIAAAIDAVAAVAARLGVVLRSDHETFNEAMTVVARIDEEIAKLQRGGGLKEINKSYRKYRIEASGRGEKILRYGEWMGNYRQNLVRNLAASLRHI